MGRDAQGVKGIELNKNDYVVDMTVIKEGYDVFTLSENGYGKRVDIEDYRLQQRGGKGVKAGVFNAKTGKLVNMKLVKEDEDIMIIADNGIIIRMNAVEISKIGRDTLGVRVMRTEENSKAIRVAITSQSEDDLLEE